MRSQALLIPLLLIAGLILAGCSQPAQTAPTLPPAQPQTDPPQVAPAEGGLAAIPQSRTAEGYQILGAADAPVTLIMYSDFF